MADLDPDVEVRKKLNVWEQWQEQREKHPWLQTTLSVLALLIVAAALAFILAVAMWAIHPNDSPLWTGFGATPLPLQTGISPYKNLWDWLGLLIIPLFLAIGAGIIGRAQQSRSMRQHAFEQLQAEKVRENEWQLEKDRQEQALVENYYGRMSHLMLEQNLRESQPGDDVRYVARAITVGVLRALNPFRKGTVLMFLYEAELIKTPDPIIDLKGADLQLIELESAVLSKAHLAGTDMHQARLDRSDLAGANLQGTDLIDAELRQTDLRKTNLHEAYLSGSHLREACLDKADLAGALLNGAHAVEAAFNGADLRGSNLVGADFSHTDLQDADLSEAKFQPTAVEGAEAEKKALDVTAARFNAATRWPAGFDPAAHGAIDVVDT